MHRAGLPALVLAVVVALTVAPGAAAKELTNVIVVGAGGRSVVVAPAKSLAMAFDWLGQPAPSKQATTGPFLLVYPLMEAGLPARPGRLYVRTQMFCAEWNTSARPSASDCWGLTKEQARRLAAPRLVPLQFPLPRLLALRRGSTRLKGIGATGPGSNAFGNWLIGVELAFDRGANALRTHRPADCVDVRAVWTGRGRPDAFCVARAGAWVDGDLYPYPLGVAEVVDEFRR